MIGGILSKGLVPPTPDLLPDFFQLGFVGFTLLAIIIHDIIKRCLASRVCSQRWLDGTHAGRMVRACRKDGGGSGSRSRWLPTHELPRDVLQPFPGLGFESFIFLPHILKPFLVKGQEGIHLLESHLCSRRWLGGTLGGTIRTGSSHGRRWGWKSKNTQKRHSGKGPPLGFQASGDHAEGDTGRALFVQNNGQGLLGFAVGCAKLHQGQLGTPNERGQQGMAVGVSLAQAPS